MIRPKTVGIYLSLAVLAMPAAAQEPACPNPQSPRNIDRQASPSPYDRTLDRSIVTQKDPDSLVYQPVETDGPGQTLYRCGQHYHFPIENPQGCPGEITEASEVKPGEWVEIHTVYAAKVRREECDPESLGCCEEGPFVVRAFNAKVTAGGSKEPIPPPTGRPLAEWSGSTTGKESEPNECKPAAAWSFRLGCDFTVSEAQLSLFKGPHAARPVQTGSRVSRDLTLVP